MASYVHFEVANSPDDPWTFVTGSSYTATASKLTFTNDDGTLTKALGSFVVFQGQLLGGAITTLERTDSSGVTTYETITGLSLDANVFVGTSAHLKIPFALGGTDILTGYSGDDYLFGGAQNDQLYGGSGD